MIDEKIRYCKSRDTVLLERCTLVLELVRDKEGIVKGALLEKQSKFPRYNMNSKGKCDRYYMKYSGQYHVFLSTFHFISRTVQYVYGILYTGLVQ